MEVCCCRLLLNKRDKTNTVVDKFIGGERIRKYSFVSVVIIACYHRYFYVECNFFKLNYLKVEWSKQLQQP